jgi:hypothetical protein
MSSPANRWRAPIIGAATGVLVAAALIGSSALASSETTTPDSGTPASTTTTPKTAPTVDCNAPPEGAAIKRPGGPSPGPGPAPFLAAVTQLVQAGTIDGAQARVLDADIRAGSIDPNQLVASGTLNSAQVQAVMARLGAVKRSLAPEQPGVDAKAAQLKRSHH